MLPHASSTPRPPARADVRTHLRYLHEDVEWLVRHQLTLPSLDLRDRLADIRQRCANVRALFDHYLSRVDDDLESAMARLELLRESIVEAAQAAAPVTDVSALAPGATPPAP